MNELLQLAAGNLLNPAILFFVLGMGAGFLRSDLTIPEAVAKGLSLYLMMAIGFKGGAIVREQPPDFVFVLTIVLSIGLSFGLPLLAFALLRVGTRLSVADAAALAAHYGSISVVTFVTAVGMLDSRGIPYEGFLVAIMALMETPAIVSGLWLARRHQVDASDARPGGRFSGELLREILLNGSVVLLLGSFAIGIATGPEGMESLTPFLVDPFKGVLCLFLLDMGLVASRRLAETRVLTRRLVAFGLYMPLIGAAFGLACAALAGLSPGGATLLMVLSASASYIAAPAAMRLAIPKANPAIYITMSLAVTFPFNIIVGIPVYSAVAQAVLGGG